MITIGEFMTANPHTLGMHHSLSDAKKVMKEQNVRHIPIVDSDRHILGLVTQRDVLAATTQTSKRPFKSVAQDIDSSIKLSDIMIRNVSTIHKPDSLRRAALYLQSHKYGCLPVVENKCLVGIITDSDFLDIAINLLEQVELTEEADVEAEIDIH